MGLIAYGCSIGYDLVAFGYVYERMSATIAFARGVAVLGAALLLLFVPVPSKSAA